MMKEKLLEVMNSIMFPRSMQALLLSPAALVSEYCRGGEKRRPVAKKDLLKGVACDYLLARFSRPR